MKYYLNNLATPTSPLESAAVSWVHKFVHSYYTLAVAATMLNAYIKTASLEMGVHKGFCEAKYNKETEVLSLHSIITGEPLITVNP